MIVTRRNLLLSATGAAAMGRSAIYARQARGATSASSRDAVTFNKTLLTNPGIPGMPTGLQQRGVVSVDWRISNLPPLNTAATIVQTTGNIANYLNVALTNNGSGGPTVQLSVTGADGANTFYAWFSRPKLDTSWHRDTFGFDTGARVVKWLADGIAVTPMTSIIGSGWAVDYTRPWLVGASGQNGKTIISPFVGDMADLTMWAGSFVDPTDPTFISAFYDTNEVPIRLGPVAWGTLDPLRPQICLSGPASQFMQNRTAGEFAAWGSVPQYFDTSPTSMFTEAAGSLVTAASDPWSDPA